MEYRSVKRAPIFILVAILVIGVAIFFGLRSFAERIEQGPDPVSIASASLQSVREQNRLVPFTARYVAVVTSTQSRFGLQAEKTLIMPGTVRYELDLAKLGADDLGWNEETQTLAISLPPLEISEPQVDLNELKEYGGQGVLTALTNAEERLDAANRQRGVQELVRQARQPAPMRMAREAARRAVERTFALPLQAAGLDAKVEVAFADERGARDRSYLDRSRRIEDVLKERQQAQPQ
jgi:hypothetical protein